MEERRSGVDMYEAEVDRHTYLAHKHYAASPSLMDYQVHGKTLFNKEREKRFSELMSVYLSISLSLWWL